LGFWSVGFEFVIRPHLYVRFGLPLHRLAATGSSVNVMTGKQLECVPFWRTKIAVVVHVSPAIQNTVVTLRTCFIIHNGTSFPKAGPAQT